MKPLIMVVDDDETFLEELSQLLQSSQYETLVVHDTKDVMDAVQKTRPDLILMDLQMPGQNGFEATFELKEVRGCESIPVIAMSGLCNPKTSIFLELSRMRKFLVKPFSLPDLVGSIEECLNRDPNPDPQDLLSAR